MEKLEVSNVLIVESHNDQYFIQALLDHLKLQNFKFNNPICAVDDYECLRGLDKEKLKMALSRLKNRLLKPQDKIVEKIGIIIDLDNDTMQNRLKLVNAAIQEIFATELAIPQVGQWVSIPVDTEIHVNISCYFMNVNGKGELETVLKAIKSQKSLYADCLEHWRNCITENELKLTDKEFDKFWVSTYHRFDCCDKKEKYRSEIKCNHEASFKKGVYDFNSPLLQELKSFLISLTD